MTRTDERGGRSSGRARRAVITIVCLDARWSGRSIDEKHTSARSLGLSACPHPGRAITINRLHYRFITFAMMTSGVRCTVDIVSGWTQRRTTRRQTRRLLTTQQTAQHNTKRTAAIGERTRAYLIVLILQ